MEQSFEELKEHFPAALQPIVDYFSRTWIGDNAIFTVQLWSQFHNVVSHQSRTNKHAEGFHSALKKFCGGAHLSFWKFLDVLILQHNLTRLDVIKHLGNVPPPPRQKKYRMIDESLHAIVDSYDITSNLLSYLNAIAGQSVFGI